MEQKRADSFSVPAQCAHCCLDALHRVHSTAQVPGPAETGIDEVQDDQRKGNFCFIFVSFFYLLADSSGSHFG